MKFTFKNIIKAIGLGILFFILFSMGKMVKSAIDTQDSLEKSIIAPIDKRKALTDATFIYRKRKKLFTEIQWPKECEDQFDKSWKTEKFQPFAEISMFEVETNKFIVGIPCSRTAYNGFISTYVYYDKTVEPAIKNNLQLEVIKDSGGVKNLETEVYSLFQQKNKQEFTSHARSGPGCYFQSTYKHVNGELLLKEYSESGCDDPSKENDGVWKIIYTNKTL